MGWQNLQCNPHRLFCEIYVAAHLAIIAPSNLLGQAKGFAVVKASVFTTFHVHTFSQTLRTYTRRTTILKHFFVTLNFCTLFCAQFEIAVG